jgi:hypothetical protein
MMTGIDQFQRLTKSFRVHIHCLSKSSYLKLTKHQLHPHSPKVCIQKDWYLLQSIHKVSKSFYSCKYQDPDSQLIVQHQSLIENWKLYKNNRNTTTDLSKYKMQFSQLRTSSTIISNNHIRYLRALLRDFEIQTYLCDRNKWTRETFSDIAWSDEEHALNQLRGRHRKTIIQLLHGWIPVNTSHSLQLKGAARLCPFCNTQDRTVLHHLSCSHNILNERRNESIANISSKLHKYVIKAPPKVIELLEMALLSWQTTSNPPPLDHLPQKLLIIFHAQSHIGWDQIVQGRLTQEWGRLISNNTYIRS